jgi:hypothetical protein
MSEPVKIALLRGPNSRDEHLRACVDDVDDVSELAHADVLYFAGPVAADDVIAKLAAYPGCVVCAGTAVDGTVLLAVRGGIACAGGSYRTLASIVHALLVRGVEIAVGGIRAGDS